MDVSATLSNGNTVLVHDEKGGYDFEILDSALRIVRPFSGSLTGGYNTEALVLAKAGGGFAISSFNTGYQQSNRLYDASGLDTGPAYDFPPTLSLQAFSSHSSGTSVRLSDGGTATATSNGSGGYVVQKYDGNGRAVGGAFSLSTVGTDSYSAVQLTPLALTGGYALAYVRLNSVGSANPTGMVQDLVLDRFSGDGSLLTQTNLQHRDLGVGPGQVNSSTVTVVGLADGGAAVAWTGSGQGLFPISGIQEVRPNGTAVVAANRFDAIPYGGRPLQLDALPDGRYVLTYSGVLGSGPTGQTPTQHTVVNTEQGASLDVTAPSPSATVTDVMLNALPPGATLSDASGWTSAAMLSNGQIAVVGAAAGAYGSHTAVAHTYDQNGAETGSAALMGYADAGHALTPTVTALPTGGFYKVTYQGSTDYEIYSATDQRVFNHNAYTDPNGAFTALTNGGYLVTNFAADTVGLFDASGGNVSWFNVNLGGATPTVTALNGGGFAFSTPSLVLGYDAGGRQTYSDTPGAEVSRFATATASLADGTLAEVWLSTDGGQNGNATSLRFETFGAQGASAAIEVAQDDNPWNDHMTLMPHPDGSATILWTHSGGLFAAEYAGGAVGPARPVTGYDLNTVKLVELPGDKIGLVDFAGGQLEARIFDPATGHVTSAIIGSGVFPGIQSTTHLLATAAGGIAASWHDAFGGVRGAEMDAAGHVTVAQGLAGDFLGVDGSGHALTLHDVGGAPEIQTYGFSDGGLFWAV
jgi:hypothetical protein